MKFEPFLLCHRGDFSMALYARIKMSPAYVGLPSGFTLPFV